MIGLKKIVTMAVAIAMVMGMSIVPSQAASKALIEDVEYDGKGVVDVEFAKDVKYKKANITVKDNKGKKYKATIVKKDSDDLKFKIRKYKAGRKYSFKIKGVKPWNAAKYRAVKGKVRIDRKYAYGKAAPANEQYIGMDEAKNIALTDAGLTADQVKFIKAKYEMDDGIPQYDIEFVKDGAEYEYEINAETGAILEKDIDVHKKPARPAKDKPAAQDPQAPQSGQYIGKAKAKAIALASAGLTENMVYMEKVELDYEDGRMVYEVEFYSEGYEYDYEIDAVSGKILKEDVEWDD